jgi:hypothetical protein
MTVRHIATDIYARRVGHRQRCPAAGHVEATLLDWTRTETLPSDAARDLLRRVAVWSTLSRSAPRSTLDPGGLT